MFKFMLFNATFNNISYIMEVSFIGEVNRSTEWKSMTNIEYMPQWAVNWYKQSTDI
jgi:hypothetical protein